MNEISKEYLKNGLCSTEVESARTEYGSNAIPKPKMKTAKEFFLDAISDSVCKLLIAMSVLFFTLAVLGVGEYKEAIGIVGVLILIGVLGTKIGLKVQKEMWELRKKSLFSMTTIIRDGKEHRVDQEEIVVGDIVKISAGEKICADGFLVSGEVEVNNMALDGEPYDIKKHSIDTCPYDPDTRDLSSSEAYRADYCMFDGSVCTSGEGLIYVTNVGLDTDKHRGTNMKKNILKLNEIVEDPTVLEQKLDDFANFASRIGWITSFIIFFVSMFEKIASVGGWNVFLSDGFKPVLFSTATVLAIALTNLAAAVPEGLGVIIQLMTGQSSDTMSKANVLAKNLKKIANCSAINELNFDKTGTITVGKPVPVHNINADGKEVDNGLKDLFLKNIALNTTSSFDENGNVVNGNITERALFHYLTPEMINEISANNNIVNKITFSSEYKFSAIEIEGIGTLYKGAPERIIEKCTSYYNNDMTKFFDLNRKNVLENVKGYTTQAFRVIATAWSPDPIDPNNKTLPDNLTFCTMVAIRDDVRPEVPDVIKEAKKAGISLRMITGDCIETAEAISRDAGIIDGKGQIAMNASDFEKLSDEEAMAILPSIKVIARALPTTKLRIVELSQKLGNIVGMGGDGSNDSLAIKKANVGFAMGSGSDLAKESSDFIIQDDNFVSIVQAIKLGRTFMHNLRKFMKYQLPINFALTALNIIYAIITKGQSACLTSTQILIVNIVMDSLNSLSFGGEPYKKEYMDEMPDNIDHGLVGKEAITQIAISTITFVGIFGLTMIPFVRNIFGSDETYASVRFALLLIIAVFNGFNIRTDSLKLFDGIGKNPMFIKIACGILIGTFVLTQFCGFIIGTVGLSLAQWIAVIILSSIIIWVDMIRKCFTSKGAKEILA